MKKIISIFLTVIIAASLFTGCTNDNKNTVNKDNSSVNTADKSKKDDDTKSDIKSKDDKKQEKVKYENGVWEDKNYKNSSINMSFTLPENWTIMNENQINALADGVENLNDPSLSHDFFIIDSKTGTNIQLLINDTSVKLGDKELTDLDYMSTLINEFESLKDSPYVCSKAEQKLICGQNYLNCNITTRENAGFNVEYSIKKHGNHIVSFVATYPANNKAEYDNFMKNLKPIA